MAKKTITVQADLFQISDSPFANDPSFPLRPVFQCRCGRLCTSNYITAGECSFCGSDAQIPVSFDMEITEVD